MHSGAPNQLLMVALNLELDYLWDSGSGGKRPVFRLRIRHSCILELGIKNTVVG